jgi:hypothetical protein
VILSGKLVKAQEGEFLTSIVEQTQEKPEREKLRSRRTLQEEENRRLELLRRELTSKRRWNSFAIASRHIGVGECKSCMHVKSRVAISRFRGSRRSLEGQVARIRRIGISAFGVSKAKDSRQLKSRFSDFRSHGS